MFFWNSLAFSMIQRMLLESINSSVLSFFYSPISHPYMTTGKTIALTIWTFVGKVMSLFFNNLSRFFMLFLPRSKHLLIPWLQSPSAVILEPSKIKVCHCFYFSHLFAMKWWDQMPWSLFFWMLSFKLTFSLFSFTLIKRLSSSSLLFSIRVVLMSSAYL